MIVARRNRLLLFAAAALFAACHVGQAAAQGTKGDATLKSATDTAKKIQEATGAKAPTSKLPAGDPCTVLSLSDVQKVFPGAKGGERSRRPRGIRLDRVRVERRRRPRRAGRSGVVLERHRQG